MFDNPALQVIHVTGADQQEFASRLRAAFAGIDHCYYRSDSGGTPVYLQVIHTVGEGVYSAIITYVGLPVTVESEDA